jgi:ectoine hydroxylase-related dioxygenase (phytanoyl-CoA dioxygenase family)
MRASTLTTVPGTAGLDDVVEVVERDGAVIIEDFVDADTTAALWSDVEPLLDKQSDGDGRLVGEKTRIVGTLIRYSTHSLTVVRQPLFLGTARHFLQRPVRAWLGEQRIALTPTIQLSVSRAIQTWPGVALQPLHRDDTSHLRTHPGPDSRVQIMLAATPFTARTGATRVIPGSHRWDDERAPRETEAVPAVMRPGSALLWLGSTYHGAGANTSDGPRTGLTYAFDLGNLRQEDNQYLSLPLSEVRPLPEDIQRLLGFEPCPPMLGLCDMTDPMRLLGAG